MANYKLLVQGVIDPAGIQTQLADLGKNTTLVFRADSKQAFKEIEKIKTSLYETKTTIKTLDEETNKMVVQTTKTATNGIKELSDLRKAEAQKEKEELKAKAKLEADNIKVTKSLESQKFKEQSANLKKYVQELQSANQIISSARSEQYASNYQYGINEVFAPGLIPNPQKITEANSEFTKLFSTTREGYAKLSSLEKKVLDLNGGITKTSKDTETWSGRIGHAIKAATQWAIAMGLLYGTLRKIQEGMQFVYDFDNQMNKIQMVTKSTNEETKALAATYANIAEQLSSTTMDVARNAEEWLRQGRTIAETNQLIKTSMIFSKVGFLDSAEAASLLTASINGYKLSVQDAMSVVDKMSAIDVAAATSTADLATALSYTATSAKLAGLELDEVLSYIAVVSDVTQQSAETIGNSFKTIFARMQQVKIGALVDEEGEDISNTAKVLESYGIQLADMTTGTFRDLGDVLGELANKWGTLTNMQRSEIAGAIAGVRQRERFIVLMDNYDKALKYQTISLESAGSAMEKFNIYQESGEAATQRLTTAFQKLFMDVDSSFLKSLINLGTGILTLIDNLGGLRTIIIALSFALLTIKGDAIISFFSKLPALIMGAVTALRTFTITIETFQAAMGLIGLALTAISVIYGIVASSNAKFVQETQGAIDKFKEQQQALSSLQTQLDDVFTGTANETEQRNKLVELLQSMNSQYDIEASKLKTVNELRNETIAKMKEEGMVAAETFLNKNKAAIATAKETLSKDYRNFVGVGGSNIDEQLIHLQSLISGYTPSETEEYYVGKGMFDWFGSLGMKAYQKQYNELLEKKEQAEALLEEAKIAEEIMLGNWTAPKLEPSTDYSNLYVNYEKDAEKARKAEEAAKAAEEAAKAAEEAQKKLEKLNQEYLERLIKLKLKAISDESVAATKLYDDQINALKKINQERQDEIDLIKAKEALLRAQTQKRMVYRAGMGFVAEVDQSAIKEAQENIIKIETEAKIAELEAKKVTAEESGKTKEQAYRNTLLQQMKAESRPYMQEVYGSFLGLTKGTDEHWYDSDGKRAFKHGGIVNFTGTAMVHGKPNEPEVMINNSQASALFKFIQGLSNPSMTRNPALAGAGGQNVYISNVNLPSVKDGYGFIKELSLISKNRS